MSTKNDLLTAALAEAHAEMPTELTSAMAALLAQHEKNTGRTVTLENTQIQLTVDPISGGIAFNLAFIQHPENVLPIRKVQVA